MMARTHFLGGLAAGGLLALDIHVSLVHAVPVGIISGISALLPDIDQPQSVISGLLPAGRVVSTAGNLVGIHHRGPTHSFLAGAAATFGFWALCRTVFFHDHSVPLIYLLAFLGGYLSHLFLDLFNKRGQPLLWPLANRFMLPGGVGIAADGFTANWVVTPALFCLVVYLCFDLIKSAGHLG